VTRAAQSGRDEEACDAECAHGKDEEQLEDRVHGTSRDLDQCKGICRPKESLVDETEHG
jgi:hypothetical protein